MIKSVLVWATLLYSGLSVAGDIYVYPGLYGGEVESCAPEQVHLNELIRSRTQYPSNDPGQPDKPRLVKALDMDIWGQSKNSIFSNSIK